MDLETAINRLKCKERYYLFEYPKRGKVKYAAVIKNPESNLDDDYIIEIGFKMGKREFDNIFIDSYSFLRKNSVEIEKNFKLNKVVSEEYNQGDLNFNYCGDIKFHYCDSENPEKRKFDKLTGGISISNMKNKHKSGTLGGILELDYQGKPIHLLISNYHILAEGIGANYGQPITHPSHEDSGSPTKVAELFWWLFEDYDVALAKIVGYPIDTNKSTRCGVTSIKDVVEPIVNSSVIKCGRSTGLTKGYIRSTNCTYKRFNLAQGVRTAGDGNPNIMRNQILTSCISRKGDSGSIATDKSGNAVGLIHSGDEKRFSICSNLNKIFALNIEQLGDKSLHSKKAKFI